MPKSLPFSEKDERGGGGGGADEFIQSFNHTSILSS